MAYEIGSAVRVVGGVYNGRTGILRGYSPDGRYADVEIELSTGSQVRIVVPVACLRQLPS
jgi:hypothetical protein